MNWRQIVKDKAKQPTSGEYGDWKEQIAEECFFQCVYCSIHESPWGGIDHYHVEHYRPKSLFKDLENDILNLFYACPVCNRFKSNDWPAECEEDYSVAAYPDPSKVNYADLIDINTSDFTLTGKNPATTYVIQRLYLNRPQLIYERREETLRKKEKALMDEIMDLAFTADDKELYKEVLQAQDRMRNLYHERQNVRPYKLAEIRKP